nr:hypothetical protein [Tanacetum cinerariifolium]
MCTDSYDSDTFERPPSQDPYEGSQFLLVNVTVPILTGEIGLGVDVKDSYEPYTEPDINPDVQADIDACIPFSKDIAARGTDVRVKDGTAAEEEAKPSMRGTIDINVNPVTHHVVSDDTGEPIREYFHELVSVDGSLEVMQRGLDVVMQELYDHMVEILVHRVRVIESVKRDQGYRIVATSQQSAAMLERIGMSEWDNKRLKGMLGVDDRVLTVFGVVCRMFRGIGGRSADFV